ncbi:MULTISPECIES: ParA family protein [Caballeronia]|uniref:ParA family protein n=1 Tax=Caballeronia TaxID=1827195 RepID=UPI00052EA4F8|nr:MULTISPECIES: ParA family protein [Caballeronia]MCE4547868.1 ParA family protein [Caballeronia sp. PC1]MCE4575578.1 ParA family protein [Caballeronia sp. CLC5]
MKIIGICNGKGGVGKTTTARHLIYSAIDRGLRTLAVDLDPQGNLSKSLLFQQLVAQSQAPTGTVALSWQHMGLPEIDPQASAHLLYQDEVASRPMPIIPNVWLIGATPELADVLTWPLDSAFTARNSLQRMSRDYDLCVIDTPPTMSNLVVGGLICSQYMLMPTDLNIDSMDGLLETSLKVDLVRREWNPELELLGVLLNKVNPRRADDLSMRTTVRNAFEGAVLEAELQDRAGVRLTSFHPVWKHQRGDSDRRAAKEMRALCDSIFEKVGL